MSGTNLHLEGGTYTRASCDMTTVQLRRYTIESGRMDDFITWVRLPHRTPCQVRVPRSFSAYADDDHSEFVWAVVYYGDFDAAEAEYMASPECC